jgi:type I restriction enzyme S subunit
MTSERLLADICEFKNSQRKPVTSSHRKSGPYPYYGAASIQDYVDEYLFEGLHVLVGEDGTVQTPDGRPMIQLVDGKFWVNNHAHILRCNNDIDTRYLAYALREISIAPFVTGAAQPKVNMGNLKRILLKWPEKKVREDISDTGRLLDDRIRLLRNLNLTLESIAQALFKSWFVDFEPVHAKREGKRLEGMSEDIASLFPGNFEQGELGELPRDWEEGTLGNILQLRNDRTKPSSQTLLLPYVPVESISPRTPFLSDFKSGSLANSSLVLFKEGDILFGAMRPYFHKVCIAPFDGVTRTTVFTLKPFDPSITAFALFCAFQEQTVNYATKNSEGSTIPYARWKNSLEKMPIVLPPLSLQVKFSEIVMPLIKMGIENSLLSNTLVSLRDTIIPRMISGKLEMLNKEQRAAS